MTTSNTNRGDRQTSATKRLMVAAGVTIVILAMAACAQRPSHVDASATPLGVSRCSQFACED